MTSVSHGGLEGDAMRFRIVILVGMVSFCAVAGAQTSARPAAPPETTAQPLALKPWVSRQTTFNIPFSVNLSQGTPSEVQLFVSRDAGRTWQFHGRQPPDAEHFAFRAGGDGSYWFASRTIDPQRNVAQVNQLRPELHVIVDTQRPSLQLAVVVGPSGEIRTTWQVTDPSLDHTSLRIEYQSPGGGGWRQVATDGAKQRQQAGTMSGEMTWWPEDQAETLAIRAEIADAAGNRAVVNRRVTRPQIATRSSVPPDPYAKHYQTSTQAVPWLADGGKTAGTAGGLPADANRSGPTTANKVENPYYSSQDAAGVTADDASTEQAATDRHAADYPPGGGHTSPLADEQVQRHDEANLASRAEAAASTPGLPAGERLQMTNSLHFQLDYTLDAVGPDGVDEVQLWGTRDFGQAWSRWSLDEDLQSPLDIHVEQEGAYGFRVVIVGRNGLATPTPHMGDLADIWVGVDVTKPTARLASVLYGEGLHAGELDIRWQVSDQSLGERPITLLFSEDANGPWNTIATGLRNSGQHYWRVDPNIPSEIYLRIEVRDEAGNLTEHQLVEPISTHGLIPKAYIRSVRPLAPPPHEEANRGGTYR